MRGRRFAGRLAAGRKMLSIKAKSKSEPRLGGAKPGKARKSRDKGLRYKSRDGDWTGKRADVTAGVQPSISVPRYLGLGTSGGNLLSQG